MIKKFRKKPIQIEAFQFTESMRMDLIALGRNPNVNPIDVKIPYFPDADTEWNWYTGQLYIQTSEGQMEVNVGDWIVKEPFDKEIKYYPVKNEIFLLTYEAIS